MRTHSTLRRTLGPLVALSILVTVPQSAKAQISWTETTGLPGENISGTWGTSPDNLYASGGYRTLDHFDGTSWSAETHPSGANRYTLYGVSANEIYSAGQAGYKTGNLMRFDGVSWNTILSTPETELVGVWADGAGRVFAAGDGRFYVYDGAFWSQPALGIATGYNVNRFESVWGSSSTNVYAVGANGNLLHWDGTAATVTQPFGSGFGLNAISGSSASDIFVVGSQGQAFHFNGTAWSTIVTGTTTNLTSVFVLTPTTVLVSGFGGALFTTDGASFTQIPSGTTRDLFDIHGLQQNGTDYWAVAASGNGRIEGGVILTGVGPSSTSTVPEPTSFLLLATGLVCVWGLGVGARLVG